MTFIIYLHLYASSGTYIDSEPDLTLVTRVTTANLFSYLMALRFFLPIKYLRLSRIVLSTIAPQFRHLHIKNR